MIKVVAAVGLLVLCTMALAPISVAAVTLPELPRVYVDTTLPTQTGVTRHVPFTGTVITDATALQSALDAANYGDTITLQAGGTFVDQSGSGFQLKLTHADGSPRTGTGWILVRSDAPASSLPPPGTRLNPSYASVLPKSGLAKILGAPAVSGNFGINALARAHHWRFLGLEVAPSPGYGTQFVGIALGNSETTAADVPQYIVVDRCYIHGDPSVGGVRGVQLNGSSQAVIDSYVAGWFRAGFESQAIGGWNGPGPFKIVNNYLEAAGENLMFGGATPTLPGVIPADMEIRQNHFFVPLSWFNNLSYYMLKNLFELKAGQRILVEGNVFENMQAAAQAGFAIVITPRSDGAWQYISDLLFKNNIIRHVGGGVTVSGTDGIVSVYTARVAFINNLWTDITQALGANGAGGDLFWLMNGVTEVTIAHNTSTQEGALSKSNFTVTGTILPTNAITWQNNIHPLGEYANMAFNPTNFGEAAIAQYFPVNTYKTNVLVGIGPYAAYYPHHTWFPPSLSDVGFVDLAAGIYRLVATSPYMRQASANQYIGADIDAIQAATGGVALR